MALSRVSQGTWPDSPAIGIEHTVLIPVSINKRPSEQDYSADSMDSASNSLKRKLLGAGILLALSAILLPLLLDGSGSESHFRRVENLRQQPPRVIGADGILEPPRVVERREKPRLNLKLMKSANVTLPSTTAKATIEAPSVSAVDLEPAAAKAAQPVRPRTVSELLASRTVVDPAPATQTKSPEPVVVSTPATDLPGAGPWLIQAASFSDEYRATTLRDQLRDRGYPSFVSAAFVQVSSTDAPRYRVQVGPLTDRTKTAQRKREIERITGGRSLVTVYSQ